MDMNYYILKDKKPVIAKNMAEFHAFMSCGDDWIVKKDDVLDGVGVSTVFLGLNHRHGEGDPILFETMIFGGEHDQYQERYETWEEAEAGHQKAIELVFSTTHITLK